MPLKFYKWRSLNLALGWSFAAEFTCLPVEVMSDARLSTRGGMDESKVSNMRSHCSSVGQRSTLRHVCTLVPLPVLSPSVPLSVTSYFSLGHITFDNVSMSCKITPVHMYHVRQCVFSCCAESWLQSLQPQFIQLVSTESCTG